MTMKLIKLNMYIKTHQYTYKWSIIKHIIYEKPDYSMQCRQLFHPRPQMKNAHRKNQSINTIYTN